MKDDLEEFDFGGTTTLAGRGYRSFAGGSSVTRAFRPHGVLVQFSTTSGDLTEFANWVYEALKKLERLGKLRSGWDSYGGKPLDPRSKELALRVLGWLGSQELPTPAVMLGSEGDVHFEWRAKGRELEVELATGERIPFVKVFPNGDIVDGEAGLVKLPDELRQLTFWLMHGDQSTRL